MSRPLLTAWLHRGAAAALSFVLAASAARADEPPRVPPTPGQRPPPGFNDSTTNPGVIVGPAGSYGNAHNGLPNQGHGACVIAPANLFRPPNPGESATDYGDYIRNEVQRIWRQNCGRQPADTTLHEGVVMGYHPADRCYRVVAVTCAPVPELPHGKFARAVPTPGTPVAPATGGGGYHMPCGFFGFTGNFQVGGCGVAAREWMGTAVTFPQGAPSGIPNVGRPPRPVAPPPPPTATPPTTTTPPGPPPGTPPGPPPGPPRPPGTPPTPPRPPTLPPTVPTAPPVTPPVAPPRPPRPGGTVPPTAPPPSTPPPSGPPTPPTPPPTPPRPPR